MNPAYGTNSIGDPAELFSAPPESTTGRGIAAVPRGNPLAAPISRRLANAV
jgi:hypothetical protein